MGATNYKSLSDKIISYNHLHLTAPQNETLQSIHDEIVFEIRIIIYHLPQLYFQLPEEDAAEFLLYMDQKIDRIINNYKYVSSDFLSYIYPILSKKIKSFMQAKFIKQHREDTIIKYHSLYETILNNSQTSSPVCVSDSDLSKSDTVRRFKFILRNHETSKKRFFIFISSLSNVLPETTVKTICKTLNFDLDETSRLISKISDSVSLSERQQTLTEKRNITWLKYLFTENKQNKEETDNGKTKMYLESLNRQNSAIKERKTTVSKTIIARILNITQSSAGLAFFYIKNIMNFCMQNEKYECKNLGISQPIFKAICNGTWENYPEPETEDLFSPFKAFKIKLCED